MSVATKISRSAVAALARAALVTVLVAATSVGAHAAAPTSSDLRYYQAVVHLLPDASEDFAGSVSFRSVVGGAVSVDVQLTRATTVDCAEGQDISTVTIATDGPEATEPGPVTLDVDRRLRTARGVAVVDLVQTEIPGCGAPETTTTLPAQPVALEVMGTSVRFRTGVDGSTSSGADRDVSRAYDLARDGRGSASVGEVVDQASDSAFLKYAVEQRRTSGTAPVPPANVAAAGGTGAQGAFTTFVDLPPGELGVVLEDVLVTASTSAPPERAAVIDAEAVRASVVNCPTGGTALLTEVLFGVGPGSVDIDTRLADAEASGRIDLTRIVEDGCDADGEPVESTVAVPVTLSLTAEGPAVRVKDTFFQVTPGEGADRTRVTYVARDAAGTVSVGDVSGAADLASISQAGR